MLCGCEEMLEILNTEVTQPHSGKQLHLHLYNRQSGLRACAAPGRAEAKSEAFSKQVHCGSERSEFKA